MIEERAKAELDPSASPSTRPWSSVWVSYYDRASRRRHQLGGYRRLRDLAKRQRRSQLVTMVAAAIGVSLLVSIFYLILTR
jgi:hypothetical protein